MQISKPIEKCVLTIDYRSYKGNMVSLLVVITLLTTH